MELTKKVPGPTCSRPALTEGTKFVVQQLEEPKEEGCQSNALSLVGAVNDLAMLMGPGISIDARAGVYGGYVSASLLTGTGDCTAQTGLDAYFVPADPSWTRAIEHYGVTWAVVTSIESTCSTEPTGLNYCYDLFLSNMTKVGEWEAL